MLVSESEGGCRMMAGLKLIAASFGVDASALMGRDVELSREVYINGLEYVVRGYPRTEGEWHTLIVVNLTVVEKQRMKLRQPELSFPEPPRLDQQYPFFIFFG
jgi:hypothetical protein